MLFLIKIVRIINTIFQEADLAVEVRIPTIFQKLVGGSKTVEGNGDTIAKVLEDLDANYPGFKERLTNEDGELHRFVNIYVNNEDIRYLDHLETGLSEGDVVTILPAVAGGS